MVVDKIVSWKFVEMEFNALVRNVTMGTLLAGMAAAALAKKKCVGME